ncbi:MAG: hypothetical protein HQL35_10110 [Alphaproteobacteria bacterium]|nr:hypothetical protein [Alphaproteobacteria bacterium]
MCDDLTQTIAANSRGEVSPLMTLDISIDRETYLVSEKIHVGALHPLTKFMGHENYVSVASTRRMANGVFFPVPISLGIDEATFKAVERGATCPLTLNNVRVGEIHVDDKFYAPSQEFVSRVYGTNDPNHPGVAKILRQSGYYLGGTVKIDETNEYFMSWGEPRPEDMLHECERNKSMKVAGFATRNVPHQGHVYILRQALSWADKVLVLASIGGQAARGYAPEAIRESFEFIIEKYKLRDRLLFGFVSMPPTLSGPNEAMLQAIIRRNYGCTHFIVGRDHAGIGNYYSEYQAQCAALEHEADLGVKIIPQKGPYFCTICDDVVTEDVCCHKDMTDAVLPISSSKIRDLQAKGLAADDRVFDVELWQHLTGAGCDLFMDGR